MKYFLVKTKVEQENEVYIAAKDWKEAERLGIDFAVSNFNIESSEVEADPKEIKIEIGKRPTPFMKFLGVGYQEFFYLKYPNTETYVRSTHKDAIYYGFKFNGRGYLVDCCGELVKEGILANLISGNIAVDKRG